MRVGETERADGADGAIRVSRKARLELVPMSLEDANEFVGQVLATLAIYAQTLGFGKPIDPVKPD